MTFDMNILTDIIGITALTCFSMRVIVQWILSEKQRRVVTPSLYWIFSLIGCYLYFVYGWLKADVAILSGQFLSVFVYIWNLKIKKVWYKIPLVLRLFLYAVPIVVMVYIMLHVHEFGRTFLHVTDVPMGLLIVGLVGNILFSSRFLYQWYYSYKHKRSDLSAGFWMISLVGSLLIIYYGSRRSDWIQVLGQFNVIVTIRNLMLIKQNAVNNGYCESRT